MKTGNCEVIGAGKLLGKKWSIAIVQELFFEKKTGFNKLKKSLKKISPRILSYRLHELETAGLIKKTLSQKNNLDYSAYSLTKKGKEFQHIINELKKWGVKWETTGAECLGGKCSECALFN